MRIRASVVAGLWWGLASVAHADTAGEKQAQGEQLARDGRYTEAIDAFKAAERLEPRAGHSCLIALAYIRRELWPQAEVFLADCHERANAADPLPDWVPLAEQQISDRLANANVAAVDIKVDPETPGTKLTVSSFAPDEVFQPRTIHLPPGHQVIIATAPGFEQTRYELEIPDKTPQHVVIKLHKPGPAVTQPSQPRPVVVAPEYTTDKTLIKAGIVVALGGGVTYAIMGVSWLKLERLHDAGDKSKFDNSGWNASYDYSRYATLGLWAVGAGLIGTGLYLRSTHHETAPMITAAPVPEGGGIVTVEWQR